VKTIIRNDDGGRNGVRDVVLGWMEETLFLAVLDEDGRVQHISEGWRSRHGVAGEVLVGARLLDAVGDVDGALGRLCESAREGRDSHAEVEIGRPGGESYWIDLHARPVRGEGDAVTGIVLCGFDITDRRVHEETSRRQRERLELVLDGGNIGCWDWNPQTNGVVFNERWCNMLGYTLSEVPQELSSWDRLVHPEDKAQCYVDIGAHVEGGRPFYENIHRMQHKDGHWVYILDRGKVMERDAEGQPVRFSGTHTDVTEIKTMELRQQEQLAREAHQQGRIDMAASILHDLGNALTGIGTRAAELESNLTMPSVDQNLQRLSGFLRENEGLIAQGLGGAKAKALADLGAALAAEHEKGRVKNLDTAAKLLHFVSHARELVMMHRTYSGAGIGPEPKSMSIYKLLLDAQVMTSDWITKRGAVFDLKCEPSLPLVVAERGKVMQVLINVLKNAAESFDQCATPGARSISTSVRAVDGNVEIDIRDNGSGFDEERAAQLFDDGFSTKDRDSGFGLAAARRVLESFGGTITMVSEGPGRGAMARILLPIRGASRVG